MKSLAHWLQVVVFDIGMAHDKTVFLKFINDRQHAVVRRYKILLLGADKQWTTLRSHTGIHTHDVDFLLNNTATTKIYPLSLHDALPIMANTRSFSSVA